ncbi:hypothetical protein BU14_0261s0005 [Porphyra umbilicalis]|uniref:Uncharacterized protein n=1 Tax=Porphyra umbilicalis TaxID=2786 RepID=A0A1X6P2N9_PORUM|nr:hypothetical protein BU14_0261s0005 [Porphyra umbilicalis]|eukprot:OSX74913.1 hypothetical protein BU14_0261s0005 [Porphyra umbilicalis]
MHGAGCSLSAEAGATHAGAVTLIFAPGSVFTRVPGASLPRPRANVALSRCVGGRVRRSRRFVRQRPCVASRADGGRSFWWRGGGDECEWQRSWDNFWGHHSVIFAMRLAADAKISLPLSPASGPAVKAAHATAAIFHHLCSLLIPTARTSHRRCRRGRRCRILCYLSLPVTLPLPTAPGHLLKTLATILAVTNDAVASSCAFMARQPHKGSVTSRPLLIWWTALRLQRLWSRWR